jgi:hypothetical protein
MKHLQDALVAITGNGDVTSHEIGTKKLTLIEKHRYFDQ